MTCKQHKSAKEDLAVAVSTLLLSEKTDGIRRVNTDTQGTQTTKYVSYIF